MTAVVVTGRGNEKKWMKKKKKNRTRRLRHLMANVREYSLLWLFARIRNSPSAPSKNTHSGPRCLIIIIFVSFFLLLLLDFYFIWCVCERSSLCRFIWLPSKSTDAQARRDIHVYIYFTAEMKYLQFFLKTIKFMRFRRIKKKYNLAKTEKATRKMCN